MDRIHVQIPILRAHQTSWPSLSGESREEVGQMELRSVVEIQLLGKIVPLEAACSERIRSPPSTIALVPGLLPQLSWILDPQILMDGMEELGIGPEARRH